MSEALSLYAQMSPVVRGLLLFVLGIVAGSYAAGLQYRIGHKDAKLGPRSRCPHCRHALGVYDLIPVVSFVCLGGKCRYCSERIAWTYTVIELSCGLTTALAGCFWGWAAGGLTLLMWIAGTSLFTGVRQLRLKDQRGFTLVEVLVASLLLAFVTGSVLQAVTVGRRNSVAAHERTLATGIAREVMSTAADQVRQTGGPPAEGTRSHLAYPQYQITTTAAVFDDQSYSVTVRVTCPTCKATSGSTVQLIGVVYK